MGKFFMDKYSLLHFATGISMYFWNVPLMYWILIHIIFEIVENSTIGMNIINKHFHGIWPGGKPSSDTFINSVGDIFFAVLGWLFAAFICK